MIKELKYNGYSANPSDYECADGDLAVAWGILPENGALHPIMPPEQIATLPLGVRFLALHKTATFNHAILFIPHLTTSNPGTSASTEALDPPAREDGSSDDDNIADLPFGGNDSSSDDDNSNDSSTDNDTSIDDDQIKDNTDDTVTDDDNLSNGDISDYFLGSAIISVDFDALKTLSFKENNIDNVTYIYIETPYTFVLQNVELPTQVTPIGNTLVVLTSSDMFYSLWKDDKYICLGTHMPELHLSFGLQGKAVLDDEFSVTVDEYISAPSSGEDKLFTEDETIDNVTEQVLAKVNKFIADNSTNAGKFLFPFFVRYAYRLYDGTLTMHSAPILMITTSWLSPQCFITEWNMDKNYVKARVAAMIFDLDYNTISNKTNLSLWSDIIKSVDIFISAPIYTYNQAGKVTGWTERPKRSKGYSFCRIPNADNVFATLPSYETYGKWWITPLIIDNYNVNDRGKEEFILPRHSDDTVKANISDCGNFYFLKAINIKDLNTSRSIITIPEDYLQSLVNREVMTDDYLSHEIIVPKYSFVYNSRLNIANIIRHIPDYTRLYSALCYSNNFYDDIQDNSDWTEYGNADYRLYIFINQDGKNIVVSDCEVSSLGCENPLIYFFYPNINAYKAVLHNSITGKYYELNLQPHNTLNGAFFFEGWYPQLNETSAPSVTADNNIPVTNKIYTSEVNNPFIFTALGINSVGSGTIIGIAAAVQALSQGQFGQFPLYAFTSDGVWALSVSDTGTYSTVQPVSRDVCINAQSITSIDSAVLFASDRGIMMLYGAQSTCISDDISHDFPFSITSLNDNVKLPAISQIIEKLALLNLEYFSFAPFRSFLKECHIIYDYTHQRIIIYNPQYLYAYIYSIQSKQWGMTHGYMLYSINSYPQTLIVGKDYTIYNISENDNNTTHQPALIITRPIKLDTPNDLKTINTIIQRGYFRKGHMLSILYASRDLFNWQLVYSSSHHTLCGFSGTPYKYFRIAIIANLKADESIYGASIKYTPRMTNKLR